MKTKKEFYIKAGIVAIIALAFVMPGSALYTKQQNLINRETFFEGFESGAIPTGWLNIDNDGDEHIWDVVIQPSHPSHSGDYSAMSESYVNEVGPLTPDNWLITVPMAASSESVLTYWVASQDPDWSQEHIEVWISTTGSSVPSDFTDQVDDYTCPAGSSDFVQRTVDLSSYDGDTIYIAFRHCEVTDMFQIKIDDITVTNVEMQEPPLQCNAGGPYSADAGVDIEFTGTATGGTAPYTWGWDFGNGDTSTEQNPTYAYPAAGEYTVTLTVTDSADPHDEASDTADATITCPLEIISFTGGFGITVTAKNNGTEDLTDVAWSIACDGGFILLGKEKTGTIDIPAGEEVTIKSFVIGLGKPTVTATVGCAEETVDATVLLFFVKI